MSNILGGENATSIKTCLISWKAGKVHIPCEIKRYGKRIPSIAVLDFKRLRIAEDGLLAQTLDALDLPCHRKRFKQFILGVEALAKNSSCREVLSASVQSLSLRHVVFLFGLHEKYLMPKKRRWKGIFLLGSHFRAYFRRVPAPLSCGSRIADVEFRSMLPNLRPAAKRTLISEAPDPGSPEGFKGPISALPHSNFADIETKAAKHLEVRLDRIETACWSAIEEHRSLALRIREHKAAVMPCTDEFISASGPLGESDSRKILKSIKKLRAAEVPHADIETYVWHWVEQSRLYENLSRWGKSSLAMSVGTCATSWSDMTNAGSDGQSQFFADYFLSQRVLLSCQFLLQIYGGWNPDTVRSLTAANIQCEPDGTYIVRPFKPRTDQYLLPKHVGKSERSHQVIELLLAHRANVDRLVPHNDLSLFAGYQRTHKVFGLFNPKQAHLHLRERYNLPPFAASQLRDQKANSLYLNSGRDVLLLKEYLGHADLLTVDTYLNHTIQRVLSAANMAEFTRRLHEVVQWAVGTAACPENSNTASLLFPIDDATHSNLCDTWLENETALTIDAAQIAHCVWQRAFYIRNFERLCAENPRRFAVIHLPRIIFCVALHHMILQSPYRFLIDRFEQLLPDVAEGVA